MQTTRSLTLLTLLSGALLAACGAEGDETAKPSRFAGKTQTEIFEIVRDELCQTYIGCRGEVDRRKEAPDPEKMPRCRQLYDDPGHFAQPISAAELAGLEKCLDDMAATPCSGLGIGGAETPIPSCKAYAQTYLDLK